MQVCTTDCVTLTQQMPAFPDEAADSICARIAAHAATGPTRLAVADATSRLTFGELETRSNQLASLLSEWGACPEQCIAIFLDRSIDFVVAAVAILKTGAAYLPLDPATPADRVEFILADAQATMLITHHQKERTLRPGAWRLVDLDGAAAEQIQGRPSDFVSVDPSPDSLAYVVYTSGSTGRPKGVEITHANLLNLIDWHQSAFKVTASDCASQVAGFGFDATGWEVWPYLTAGACLHIADELTRRSAHVLREWLLEKRITVSFVPTVLAEQLLHASWPTDTALRMLLTGADALHRRPAAGLPFVFVNNYGPTECTVVATSGTVTPDNGNHDVLASPPSIGRPIADTVALILDSEMRPVPIGDAGELCLAGTLVGRGYRNNPEMTATRFVHYTPASGIPIRMYRTGDRAKLLPNGEIAFLGRLDDQVKLRGYRIELGEIVAWLDRCPGIDASAVVVRDLRAGSGAEAEPQLVAYIIPAHDAKLSASDLREFLAARLPDYMLPASYVTVTALPMTTNGKLDKSALPSPGSDNLLSNQGGKPDRVRHSAAHGEGSFDFTLDPGDRANSHGIEGQVADIVASLLGQAPIKREDNFFMAGGHSMLGVQLVARVRDVFGVKMTLRQLFGAPTIAALSVEVSRLKLAAAVVPAPVTV